MSQHSTVHHQDLKRYSRTDFTALRAWVQRIPTEKVRTLYYVDEAPQVQQGLEKFLTTMRQDLIERSILANPLLADLLAKAKMGGQISSGVLDLLIKAADAKPSPPTPDDHIGQWLRVKVATQLTKEGISTLRDLKAFIESNGPSWWRPIPRVGALRAKAIVTWLNKTPNGAVDPGTQVAMSSSHKLSPLATAPIALERIAALPHGLDGSDGINRSPSFCFIAARNDLAAVHAYLQKFKQQPHTKRAYQRELERFLLWCVLVRGKALSSVLVDDCEVYKDFLQAPSKAFTGPRRGRFTTQWRPFAGPLSPESQKQAVQILRTAFSWLQSVRYLGGNPWAAVGDPRIEQQLHAIHVERSLPSDLYEKTVALLSAAALQPEATQERVALAILLLLGDCGLRISEAAGATLDKLEQSSFTVGRFQLTVLGKRSKLRTVPLTPRTYNALQSHQSDLRLRYPNTKPLSGHALVRPVKLPHSKAIQDLHLESGKGYAPNALARVVTKALKEIAGLNDIDAAEMIRLRTTSAHGLRHTFGTNAIEDGMPADVVQSIFGHESLNTTSIYVRAKERRVATEAEKLVQKRVQ